MRSAPPTLIDRVGRSRLVTIGLPVFNGEPFIEQALRSLLTQDHPELEIIVADNASTDSTLEICRDVVGNDLRVRIMPSDRNLGAAWNYNRVLEAASGPYFKWAASDDLCLPAFVSECVGVLESEGRSIVIAFPRCKLIDGRGELLRQVDDSLLAVGSPSPHRRLEQLLRNRFEWHPVFGVMRTDAARATCGMGGFVLADVVFLAEMALRGGFAQVNSTLFLRRYHDERPLIARPRFKDQAAWFDTDGGRGGTFPQVNMALELARSVGRAELSRPEKGRCLVSAWRAWVLPHWRHIGGEVKLASLERLDPRRRRPPPSEPDAGAESSF